MIFIYNGDFLNGKTKLAIKKANSIIEKEKLDSGKLLIFLSKVSEISRFKDEITTMSYGELNINNSISFITKEVIKYWPIITKEEGLASSYIVPKIINRDISRYILERIIHKKRLQGFFSNITSTNRELASNILMSMNIGALNKLSLECIPDRLLDGYEQKSETIEKMHNEMKIIICEFKKVLLAKGMLEASMAVELFRKVLINNTFYIENSRKKYNYLIIDDGQDLPPVIVDFILKIKASLDEMYIFYNENYVKFSYLGGDLKYLKKNLFEDLEVFTLENNNDYNKKKLINMINEDEFIIKENNDFKDFLTINLHYNLRVEMIEALVSEIKKLISAGYKKEDIAIISPYRDNILIHKVKKALNLKDDLLVVGEKKEVFEDEILHGLLTITLLAEKLKYSKDINEDKAAMIAAVLKIDLLKAYSLLEYFDKPSEVSSGLPKDKENKLKLLLNFIFDYKNKDVSISEFLRRAYLQFFIDDEIDFDSLSSCRELFNIVEICENVFKEFWQKDKIPEIITNFLINEAKSEALHNKEEMASMIDNSIIFSTLNSFMNTNYNKKVLFIVDASSEGYITKDKKNLFNSEILLCSYDKDEDLKDSNSINLLRALISKGKEKMIFLGSNFSERGYEQETKFSMILQDIFG